MYRKFLFLSFFIFILSAKGQIKDPLGQEEKPKLVVGIIIDQMRYDYLTRFWKKFSDEGFKKLINEGYNFKNNHFNYIPTYTGPGHTSVFTGTSPMNHGIIGNNWYDKFTGKMIYCTEDDTVNPIGTESKAGKMSPHRMKSTSIADQNRLHTQMRGKTIGVALKDRGSILPAGHTANAAYWFHGQDEGKWITSSFYLDELPEWVKEFNNSHTADSYFKSWNTLHEIETYVESGPDKNNFEGGFLGKETASFPYDLKELREENGGYDLLKTVPYGNDLTTDFALAAIEGEKLGMDNDTDFLTLSYSSSDYVGHNFGVNSKEIQDTYLRLDKNIANLLKKLNAWVGAGNYTIFITSDHGAVDVPSYLQSVKIPAGYLNSSELKNKLKNVISEQFDEVNLIKNISNNQIFFNYEALRKANIKAEDLEEFIAHYLLQEKQVDKVFTRNQLLNTGFNSGIGAAIKNGFNQKRSGDVIFVPNPATISYSKTGSTHGSGFIYDTHAPLIFFGKGIKQGSTTVRSEIVDIAPTIAALLGISYPNATSGKPLYMMLDK